MSKTTSSKLSRDGKHGSPTDSGFKFRLIGKIIRMSGLGDVTLVFLAIFLACAAVIAVFEPQSDGYGNAVWCCFQVATTIGFGDVSVSSPVSRAACMVLSVMSIFFIAVVTGAVVSYCSEAMRAHDSISDSDARKSAAAKQDARVRAIEVDDELLDKLERLPELSQSELENVSARIKRSLSD